MARTNKFLLEQIERAKRLAAALTSPADRERLETLANDYQKEIDQAAAASGDQQASLQHLVSGNRHHVFLAGIIGAVSVFKSDRWMIDFAKRSHRTATAVEAVTTAASDVASNP